MPRDPHDDSNVEPERQSSNGGSSPGADPGQNDNPADSQNGQDK